ncbi:MAG: sterol desaturase family protein [Pseudomonadota bacterium]
MSLIKRLWLADLPDISERHRWLADLFMVQFTIVYIVLLVATYHYIFLGPLTGEEVSFRFVLSWLAACATTGAQLGVGQMLLWFAVGALVLNVSIRALVIHRAYHAHQATFGHPLPLNQLIGNVCTNLLNMAFTPLVLLVLALLARCSGYSWEDGWSTMTRLRGLAEMGIARVPTIVDLPRPLAFLVVLMVVTLVHYWAHRLSHTMRFMWLVIHRLHHVTEDISPVTTLPSLISFPIVFVLMVPYLFIFGALSKLFYPEPLLFELIAFNLVIMVAEMYNHAAALHQTTTQARWLRWLGFSFSLAGYHLLHHASDRDERFRKTAYTANLGPGLFCCWDKLFGTYRPLGETVPLTGLVGRPRLVTNPLRLLVAGVAQIACELAWNKSWRTRFWIIFGDVDYAPPISKDFILYDEVLRQPGRRCSLSSN